MLRPIAAIGLTLLAALTSACGYRLLRAETLLGQDALVVMPFAEQVPLGLSPELAEALRTEVSSSGLRLAADASRAPLLLRGTIVASNTTASQTPSPSVAVRAYAVEVLLDAELVEREGGVRFRDRFRLREDFLAASTRSPSSNLETEANRRRALARIAERAASEIWSAVLASTASTPPDAGANHGSP